MWQRMERREDEGKNVLSYSAVLVVKVDDGIWQKQLGSRAGVCVHVCACMYVCKSMFVSVHLLIITVFKERVQYKLPLY